LVGKKYSELMKQLTFENDGSRYYRQSVKIGKAFHGLNVHIQYGSCGETGAMGGEFSGMHIHKFDQLLLWIGSDVDNLTELGAEIELCLGEEREKHLFTVPTAVAVPKGLPHFPATIRNVDRPFQYMEISLAPEFQAISVPSDDSVPEAPLVSGFQAKYRKHIFNLPFRRKGPYFYGANNPEDSGGVISFITGKESGLDLHISYESIKNAPYTFGPAPHRPHAHKFEEILLFMGADCNNLNEVGVEGVMEMGKERVKHAFAGPTAIVCPYQLPHCPLTVTKVDKPFLFMVVSCAAEHH